MSTMKSGLLMLAVLCVAAAASAPPAEGWVLDPALTMPQARSTTQAARDAQGRIYIPGGVLADGGSIPLSTVLRFDESFCMWEFVSELNIARRNLTAASDSYGRIYAIGGWTGTEVLATVERYDPDNPADGWVILEQEMPAPRLDAEAVTDSVGRIYVVGGEDDTGGPTSEVFVFDSDDPQAGWQHHSTLNQGRAWSFGLAIDSRDRIYVLGGSTALVERFDLNAPGLGWELLDELSSARDVGAAVADSRDFIYAIGGWRSGYSCEVERFNPITERWESFDSINQCRNNMAAIRGDSGRLYALGGDAGFAAQATVEYFEPGVCGELQKIVGDDTVAGDQFGYVAVSGDTAVVGAPEDTFLGVHSGTVYVHRFDGIRWVQVAQLVASDYGDDDEFGGAVSIDGPVIAIGATQESEAGGLAGAAYVFVEPEGGWESVTSPITETVKLVPADLAAGHQFGRSVAVHGDAIVAGALTDGHAGASAGSAYVFEMPPAGWGSTGAAQSESAKLIASDASGGSYLGVSVAMLGDTVVAGAYQESTVASQAGAVYVFKRPLAGWASAGGLVTETAKLATPDASQGDLFGYSVDMTSDIIVVGAYQQHHGPGKAYVFEKPSGDDWGTTSEAALLSSLEGSLDDFMGVAVTISGDRIAVGAPFVDGAGGNSGVVYVFLRPTQGWTDMTETTRLEASDAATDAWFGSSVSLSGPTLFVGAPRDPEGGSRAGAAYVHSCLDPVTPLLCGEVLCKLSVPEVSTIACEMSVAVTLKTNQPLSAVSSSLALDPAIAELVEIQEGALFDSAGAPDVWEAGPVSGSCGGADNGVQIAFILSNDGSRTIPPGEHEIARLLLRRDIQTDGLGCSPTALSFQDGCLGSPPVSIICSTPDGEDLVPVTEDGMLYPGHSCFIRGDANSNGQLTISDAVKVIAYRFQGAYPVCLDAADADDDGSVDIVDAIYLVNYLFRAGPECPPPFPESGADPTVDTLGCDFCE